MIAPFSPQCASNLRVRQPSGEKVAEGRMRGREFAQNSARSFSGYLASGDEANYFRRCRSTINDKPSTPAPMSLDSLRHRLADPTRLDAPVGFEEPVLRYVIDALQPLCAEVTSDVRGNVYGRLPGRNPQAPLVMITAHADEIG